MRLLLTFVLSTVLLQAALPEAETDHVRTLLKNHKLDEAAAAAKSLVAAHPEEAEAYAQLASVCIAQEAADAAITAAEKAAKLSPTSAEYLRQLGDTYGFAAHKAGMFGMIGLAKKCRRAYEQAVALDPKNADARQSLFEFYRMAPSIMGGGSEKALEQAKALRELDPVRGQLATAMLHLDAKQFQEAHNELVSLLKTSPDHYAALYQFGKLAAASGQFLDEGLASLRRCLELPVPEDSGAPGHAAAQWRLGNIFEKKGDVPAARAAYEAALKLDPKFTQAAESLKHLK